MKHNVSFSFIKLTISLIIVSMTISCTKAQSADEHRDPVVVAHRGGADLGMENSLSCIERGIASGADMVEIDVHLTSDGEVVVCHDPTVDRTTNGKGQIEEMTLAQLRTLRLLDSDGIPSDETLPTLEEVLLLIKGQCGLLLEIKKKEDQYKGIEQKVADLLTKHDMVSSTIVQSFNMPVLEEMHRIMPTLRLEHLSFLPPSKSTLEEHPYIASYNICRYFATRRAVRKVHQAGKEMKIWTVTDHCRATRLPVDGIITNRPDLFVNKSNTEK